MQCLEVSGAVRLIYTSLGVKGLKLIPRNRVTQFCFTLCWRYFGITPVNVHRGTVFITVINTDGFD